MPRVVLGSRWREIPLIVRLLLLPSTPNPVEQRRWRTDHDFILKPPAPRGYGYATPEDLKKLGYDPDADRARDLERWRHDLQLAADAGLITQAEGEQAWQSATQNHHRPSQSSTGTTFTSTSTKTKPSSTASRSAAVGPPSPRERKPANRRSSSGWWWTPPGAEQQ